jgi:hypothetical protein
MSAAISAPRNKARLTGAVYLLGGTAGAFSEVFVLSRLVDPGNAVTTASNILAQKPLFWAGFTAALISAACQIIMAALFYGLFRHVSRSVSLMAAFFLLMEGAILAVGSLFQLASMLLLEPAQYLSAFPVEQTQAFALLLLNLDTQAFNISLVFFGFWCVLIGFLIFRSTFMPRMIGILMALAGVGYLTILSPPLASYLSPYNLAPAALGEPALILWLLLVGVNSQRWSDRALTAETSLHR